MMEGKDSSLDRVGEVYNGTYGSDIAQMRTKDRVNWICKNVHGKHILDIGCSQGIVDLLLARQGRNVLAIDIEKEAIAYAQTAAAKEPLDVQRRLRYVCADFIEQDIAEETFDGIICTELLEHLDDPARCLAKTASLLRKDGQIVIMVPYGINPHPDHKRTYYYLDFINIIKKYFNPQKVEFLYGWVAVIAGSLKSGQVEAISYDENFISSMEKSVAFIDSSKQRRYDVLRKKADQEIQSLQTMFSESERKREKLENELKEFKQLQQKTEQELEAISQREQDTQKELGTVKQTQEETASALDKAKIDLDSALKDLRIQKAAHRKWKDKYTTLSKSKLGSLQVRWWKFRNRHHKTSIAKTASAKEYIRDFVFQHTLLLRLYYFFCPSKKPKISHLKTDAANEVSQQTEKKEKRVPLSKTQYYSGRTDEGYFERIAPLLEDIKDSDGSKFYTKSPLRIGCVLDEFQYNTYSGAAEMIYLRPDDYKKDIDILLIISPWRGIDLAWKGIGNPKNRTLRERLFELIQYYKGQQVKTVFYSKEDPGNYAVFIEIAQACDYIFTSEQDCIDEYVRDTGKTTVFYLPFAVNPLYHNPIGLHKHLLPEVVFSGTWWGYKYPERIEDQYILLDGILCAGKKLKLIDRNYDTNDLRTAFPEKYLPFVSPSIAHKDLQKVHKLYTWSINLNSAKYSSTMFASRVIELQALGCNMISNYSKGMLARYPDIPWAQSKEEIAEIIRTSPEEKLYESRIAGIRRAMSQETIYHRLDYILQSIDIEPPDRKRTVLVLAEDIEDERVREMFERQSYPHKSLAPLKGMTDAKTREYDCYTFFNPGYEYGAYYLEDMINAFKFTNSDFVTRDAFYQGGTLHAGIEHDYVDTFHDRFKTVFWNTAPFSELEEGKMGWKGYSVDHLNISIPERVFL